MVALVGLMLYSRVLTTRKIPLMEGAQEAEVMECSQVRPVTDFTYLLSCIGKWQHSSAPGGTKQRAWVAASIGPKSGWLKWLHLGSSSGKDQHHVQAIRTRVQTLDSGKIPWRWAWQPLSILAWETCWTESLLAYNPGMKGPKLLWSNSAHT